MLVANTAVYGYLCLVTGLDTGLLYCVSSSVSVCMVTVQAAILTGRRSKTEVSVAEIDDSVDRIVAGMEGTAMVDSKSKSLVAYHEVGHAVCGTLTPGPSLLRASVVLVSFATCLLQLAAYSCACKLSQRLLHPEPSDLGYVLEPGCLFLALSFVVS